MHSVTNYLLFHTHATDKPELCQRTSFFTTVKSSATFTRQTPRQGHPCTRFHCSSLRIRSFRRRQDCQSISFIREKSCQAFPVFQTRSLSALAVNIKIYSYQNQIGITAASLSHRPRIKPRSRDLRIYSRTI